MIWKLACCAAIGAVKNAKSSGAVPTSFLGDRIIVFAPVLRSINMVVMKRVWQSGAVSVLQRSSKGRISVRKRRLNSLLEIDCFGKARVRHDSNELLRVIKDLEVEVSCCRIHPVPL